MTDENRASQSKKMVVIKQWNVVAMWHWSGDVDTCAICKNQLSDLCVECHANGGGSETECQVAWGQCNHAFHHHCIAMWVKTRATCPLDDREWEMSSVGNNS